MESKRFKFSLGDLFDVKGPPEKFGGPIDLDEFMRWQGQKEGRWARLAEEGIDIAFFLRDTGSLVQQVDGSKILLMKIKDVLWVTTGVALVGQASVVLDFVRLNSDARVFVEKRVSKIGRTYLQFKMLEGDRQVRVGAGVLKRSV